MQRPAALVLALLAPLAATSDAGHGARVGTAVTPVQKVLDMLAAMGEKGKQEKHTEEVAFAKFKEFCRLTSAEKDRTIKTAGDEISQLQASVTMASTEADRLGGEIAGLDGDIAGWEADTKNTTAVRHKERSEYEATHQDYSESIDALERAVGSLKAASADVPQGATALLELHRVAASKTAAVLPKAAALTALLQEEADATEANRGAPQADAYAFQSSDVLDMLEKLRLRFIDERRSLEQEELNRKHAFEQMMQALADDTAYATSSRSKKAVAKAGFVQDVAEGQANLAETQASKEADETYLHDLTARCQLKSQEFEARQTLRVEELDAIQKAIDIISSPGVAGAAESHLPSALLQVRRHSALVQLRSAGVGNRLPAAQVRASSLLRRRAKQARSSFLESVAGRVAEDPFGKVRKMIKDLLTRLVEEANEEADHKGWCDHELATNKQSRNDLTSEVDSLTGKIDELSALSAKLGQEIGDLSDAIAAGKAAVAKATKARQEEKTTNLAVLADAKEAQKAVLQATKILKEFYARAGEATAFVQQGQTPAEDLPATWSEAYTGMQGETTGVIGMLEVIQSDFARLEAETSAAEDEAQREHSAFLSDSEVDQAVKDKEMRHKGFEKERTARSLNGAKKEMEATQEELTAAMDYYEKLRPTCVDSGNTYEDRVARRQEEIASLQEALKVLEGEDLSGVAPK